MLTTLSTTMVDSREGEEMADQLAVRVEALETKVDVLSTSMHQRFEAVDVRFDAVDVRFDAVDVRFDAVDARFDRIDARFQRIDARMDAASDAVDAAFLEQRQYTELVYERLDAKISTGFARTDAHLARLERKIERLIDSMPPTTRQG